MTKFSTPEERIKAKNERTKQRKIKYRDYLIDKTLENFLSELRKEENKCQTTSQTN